MGRGLDLRTAPDWLQRPTCRTQPQGRDIWRDRRALGWLAFFRPGGRGADARRPKAARQPRSDYVWREGDCRGSDNAK
jgi:hypothetical protein